MSYDLKCPYCDTELEINHDDGFGYKEGIKHEMECKKCSKNFVFETSISFYYEPQKADCLNEGQHKWKPTNSYPKFYTQMECTDCGNEREPTKDERELHKIPTYQEYLSSISEEK